jgi:arabinofuranosyltransferase
LHYPLAVTSKTTYLQQTPPWSALLPAILLFALLAWRLDWLCDDSYISFRYSHNAALGHGLRYNLTLGDPVEGYSNFLWVVWLALIDWVGLDIPLWSRISSALCGALLVVSVARYASRRLDLGPWGAAATGLIVATLPPVAVWATGGLATMPTALLVFLAFERLLGDPERPRGIQAGLFGSLAGLIRADGSVWIIMLLGCAALLWAFRGKSRELGVAILQAAALPILLVGTHICWRYGYYGDFLPNTARVKAGYSSHRLARGVDYLAATLLTLPSLGLILVLALGSLRKSLVDVWLPALVLPAGSLLYAAYVGGDFMPMGRFLFPSIAFFPILFALAWKRIAPEGQGLKAAGFLALLLIIQVLGCFDLNLVPDSVRSRFHFRQDRVWESEISMQRNMKERAENWALQGKALALFVQPGESMSLGAIGAMGYFSGLELYDSYGLVTPSVIAAVDPIERSSPGHDRRVGPMFFNDQHPTYAGSVISDTKAPVHDQLGDFSAHPLSRLVEIERHPLPSGQGFAPGSELRLLRFQRWE